MANKSMSQYKQNGQNYIIDDPTVAQVFVNNKAFAQGEYVKREGRLYRFREDHPIGAWRSNGSHIKNVTVGEELNTKAGAASIAVKFVQNTAYASGAYVYYLDDLYQFTSAHTAGAAWDASIVRGPLALATELASISIGADYGDRIDALEAGIVEKISKPESDPSGTEGQVLRSLGNGATEWADYGLPSDEQTAAAINSYMDDHPEIITDIVDAISALTGDDIPIEEGAASSIADTIDAQSDRITALEEAAADQTEFITETVEAEVAESLGDALENLIIQKTYSYTMSEALAPNSGLDITAAQMGASTPSGYTPIGLTFFRGSANGLFLGRFDPTSTDGKFLRIRNGGSSNVPSANVVTIRVAYFKSDYGVIDPT